MRPTTTVIMGLAALTMSGLETVSFAQSRITTTGRIYPPTRPSDEQADTPASETETPEVEEIQEEAVALGTPDEGVDDAPPDEPEDEGGQMDLVCIGGGSANKASVGTVNAWNSYGDYASATVVGQRSQGFEDQVRIRLNDEDPRLRMPRSMLPGIRGGKDGWFKLKNVEYGEGEITASIAVNFLNNPKLRLDRYTGAISISGKAGDFTGQCRKFDPNQVEKAF